MKKEPKILNVMRISALFLFLCVFSSFASKTNSQNAKVNINGNNLTIGEFIDQVEKQTDYLFVYSKNEVNTTNSIAVKTGKKSVSQYLNEAFNDSEIRFAFENDYIVLTKNAAPSVAQQKKIVKGVITDSKGETVIGANVVEKGTTNGTITGIDGDYSLSVSPGAVLVVSYIGYLSKEIPVGSQAVVNAILTEDSQALDEVVVVGYGTQKKVTLTGAVSAIKSEDIVTTKNENAQNMLTGKVPGVRVVQKSAEPGAFNNTFDIRGMGNPLIIIDGVPRDNMTRLDANDIESLSVLKDASAAIYGVRAANGVVLITTKKGKNGTLSLEYSGNVGWQNPSGSQKSVSATDWMTLKNEKSIHRWDGEGSRPFDQTDIDEYLTGKKVGTDWWDACMRTLAPQTQHTVSATGGTEKLQFYLSAGYLYQESFLKSNSLNYDRFNVRSNVTAKLTDRLTVDFNVSGIMDQQDKPYQNSDWIIRAFQRCPAIQPIYANNNPNYLYYGMIEGDNPVAMMDADVVGYKKYNNKWFQTSMTATYAVPYIDGLTAKAMFSYDFQLADNTIYRRAYDEYLYDEAKDRYEAKNRESKNKIDREHFTKQSVLYQFSLNYNRSFNKVHNINALVLLEGQRRDGDNFFARREVALDMDKLFAGNTFNQEGTMSTTYNNDRKDLYQEANMGLIGKLAYDFNSKYLAEFSFRYDGSSRFGSGGQWGFFPSGSIGWRFSEEDFWKNSPMSFVNNAKLRASYGKLGDDNASNYQFVAGYTYPSSGAVFGDGSNVNFVNAAANKGVVNPYITWYVAKTLDLGIDLEAWNGQLGISADYFSRERTGLLATRSLSFPSIIGANLPEENLNGDLTRGVELEISHRNKIGEVGYNVKGIYSFSRVKTKYQERSKLGNSYKNWRENGNDRYNNIWFGYSGSEQFGSYDQIANSDVYYDRNKLPGDYIYDDWNGDGVINDLDKHPIAHNLKRPYINFSLALGADYKGFDLNILLQGAGMNYVEYIEQLREPLWGHDNSNAMEYFMDRWHPTDPWADPYDPNTQWTSGKLAYTGSLPDSYSTFNIHNASYLRLKNIELGYTLPNKWIAKSGLKYARVYVNGYNLLTIKGIVFDPEHTDDSWGNVYPLSRTFSVGLNVKF